MPNVHPNLLPVDPQLERESAPPIDWLAVLRVIAWLLGGGFVLLAADRLVRVLADWQYQESVEFAWVR